MLLLTGLALAGSAFSTARAQATGPQNKIEKRELDIELGRAQPAPHQQRVSSGVVYALLNASGELDNRANAHPGDFEHFNVPDSGTNGCPNRFVGGAPGSPNIRVNQDCSLRRQAEEVVAVNPVNNDNLIAGMNDSRIGFNHCAYAWSSDGGKTWGDQVAPFYQFVLADGHTADACSDPTATFDANGNAYVGGVLFDISGAASAFVVAKSKAGIGGRFYHSPAAVPFQTFRDSPLGVVASDNDPNVVHDKEFLVADSGQRSSKRNNVYATWTRFNGASSGGLGFDSPIFFSQSTDGGATWSPGVEIDGASASICGNFSGETNANACDQDQGSHPVVGPDGTVYVAFLNFNTPSSANQYLVVKCPANKDCSTAANWSAPVRIQAEFGGQPVGPDPATGCPAGRGCLPPNGYRVDDATFGSLSVDGNGKVYHVFSDFRNGGGSCAGNAATAKPPCDQDVFYSYSTDGGSHWSTAYKLTPPRSAQWQPWSAVTTDGSVLWVAYYDRSYGNCELTGCNDITLARVGSPASAHPNVSYSRVTTDSMPNMVVANNPLEAGFLGDYMWVSVDSRGRAHVVWADTRGLDGNVESDVYFSVTP